MDILSKVSSILNALSATCVMPLISIFYTGWLEISFENVIVALLTFFVFLLSPFLCFRFAVSDEIGSKIDGIENVNHQFLPVYLGYFFVTFSISDIRWFVVIYAIIVIMLVCSKLMYFNSLFLCFGYSFYKVHTVNGISCYVVSKRYIQQSDGVSFTSLKRLNNMTYLEKSK